MQHSFSSATSHSRQPFGVLVKYFQGVLLVALSIAAFSLQAATVSPSPTSRSSNTEIKDAEGRIRYIVDLKENDNGRPASFRDAESKITYQRAKSAQLIEDVTRGTELKVLGTTSLVGTSFNAFLTQQQILQFSKDPRVSQMTKDTDLTLSALWNSTTDSSGQVRSWGLDAMGVSNAGSSNGGAIVYVLDTGVDYHSDLNVISRLTAVTASPAINPIGCNAHATHVAGIAGAYDNSAGVVGVNPGVKIVSIALGDYNVGSCSEGTLASSVAAGLEKIYQMVLQSNQVAVVNISLNGDGGLFHSTGTVGLKMKKVATPSYLDGGYVGAFVVQSAGNDSENACIWSYDAPGAYDGIFVVGGFDDNGQAVVPFSYLNLPLLPTFKNAYVNMPLAANEPGTNFNNGSGSCVEVWAPSQRIKSTWSAGEYQFLSGTSMAAPHISGFAARLMEADPYILTSTDVEAAVRSHFATIAGSGLTIAQLSPVSVTAFPTIEIAEGSARSANRSSVSAISFDNFADQLNFRYQAVGAATTNSCIGYGTLDGNVYLLQYLPASYTFPTTLAPGQYHWEITCYSPQGTQSTAVANATIWPRVSLAWVAKTTSTANMDWEVIPNGGTVTWSALSNAPFDQYYYSTGANNCSVVSSGYTGNPANDTQNPNYVPFQTPPFSGTELWNSNLQWGPMPTSYSFATFYFGGTPLSGLYDGYKWYLTCSNAYETKTTVMYGKPLN